MKNKESSNIVSKLALGTVQFGLNYGINNSSGQISRDQSISILEEAHKSGIDILDTARAYGNSEVILGEIGVGKFKIVTKLPSNVKREAVRDQFLVSKKALRLDKIYGYLFHDFSSFENDPKIWDEFVQLKSEGQIEKIGFSLYHPSDLKTIKEAGINFDIIQVPYSIFDQRFEPYFEQIKKDDCEIHVRSVFLQGLVFKDPDSLTAQFLEIKDKLRALREIASGLNVSLSSLALNFAISNNNIDKVVIGVDNISNLHENIEALNSIDLVRSRIFDISALKEDNEEIILPYEWKNK